MKINGIAIARLTNDVHFQFHTEVRDLIESEKSETLGIKPMFDGYASLLEREDEALKRINKSSLTEDIREADRARDETFGAMYDLNGVMLRHFNPGIKAAAKRIQVVLDTYKPSIAKSLIAETSAIYNLLQELDLPKYADDCINCYLNPWRNELKNRNEALEKLMKERFDENAFKTDIHLKDARREVDSAYRSIEERINAAIVMEGVAKYESFVKRLNSVIEKYAAIKPRHRHKHPVAPGTGDAGDAGEENENENK